MHPSERIYTRWPEVEGYCTPLSPAAGTSVELRVASRAETFSVDVARWSLEPEVVWSAHGLRADDHRVPPRHPAAAPPRVANIDRRLIDPGAGPWTG